MIFLIRQKPQNKKKESWEISFKSFIESLLFFILPISKYKIFGHSMYPTFCEGDIVLINKLSFVFQKPRLKDIVAVKDPRDGKILIKRIARIQDNQYFVEGDNKLHSTDSREFGMLKKRDIVGKVIFVEI